jgi:hypothetical protein
MGRWNLMPFVFAVLGVLFLIVAINGTQSQLFTLLKSEFVGTNSFVPWASAIIILGLIGYAKPVKPISDALIGLILLALLLANKGGFFAQFNSALKNPVAPSAANGATTATSLSPDATSAPFYSPSLSGGQTVTTPQGETMTVPPWTNAPGGF